MQKRVTMKRSRTPSRASSAGGSGRSGSRAKARARSRGLSAGRRTMSAPAVLEDTRLSHWEPPPNSARRYNRIELGLTRMVLEMNHARVLADAWLRWDRHPGPGPIPPPQPPKDPARAQLQSMAEHHRRLGQARDRPPHRSIVPVRAPSVVDTKKGDKEKDAAADVEVEAEEEKGPKPQLAVVQDPCQILQEPCRRLFKGTCHPCPVHTPGVPRDPKKKCTCMMKPRPETRRDALNFLIGLPRELHATYSSLDPARIEAERNRKKSEARWRRRLEQQQQRFDRAMRRARALVAAHGSVPKPPFVPEHNELTFARGLPTVRLNLVF